MIYKTFTTSFKKTLANRKKSKIIKSIFHILFVTFCLSIVPFESWSQQKWPYTDVTDLTPNSVDFSPYEYISSVYISIDPRSSYIVWSKNNWIKYQFQPVIGNVKSSINGRNFEYTDFVSQKSIRLSGNITALIQIPAVGGGIEEEIRTEPEIITGAEVGRITSNLVSNSPIWRDRDSYKPVCEKLRDEYNLSCTRENVTKQGYNPNVVGLSFNNVRISGLDYVNDRIGLLFNYEELIEKGDSYYNQSQCEEASKYYNDALSVELPTFVKDNLGINETPLRQKMESCDKKIQENKEIQKSKELVDKAKTAESEGDNEKALEYYKKAREINSSQNIVNSIEYLEKEVKRGRDIANNKEDLNAESAQSAERDSGNENSVTQNAANSYRSESASSTNQASTQETDREYRKWESAYQQSVQAMLDEMEIQSASDAQIAQQRMDAIDQAATNVAGAINQVLEQRRADRKRNKHLFISDELSNEIEWQSNMFDKEMVAYKNTVEGLNDVLNRYGKDIDKSKRDEIVATMDQATEKIKEINQLKTNFVNEMSSEFDAKFRLITDHFYNMEPSREDIQKYIRSERTSYTETSNSYSFNSFDLEYLLRNIAHQYDHMKPTPENAIYEVANIAQNLDEDRPSVDPPSYGYFGYYTPYLSNGEKNMINKIEQTDTTPSVELLAMYGQYFPNGAYRAEAASLLLKIAKENKSIVALETYLEHYEDGPYTEEVRELKPKYANWEQNELRSERSRYFRLSHQLRKKAEDQHYYGGALKWVTGYSGTILGGFLLYDYIENEDMYTEARLYGSVTTFVVGLVTLGIGVRLQRNAFKNKLRSSKYMDKARSIDLSVVPRVDPFERSVSLAMHFRF